MDEAELRKALAEEYLHLQKVIEEFDARALTIKTWSITFSLAAIAGAFASHSELVLIVSSLSSMLFWFLEAIWKSFQIAYYRRTTEIERHFDGSKPITAPFQIGSAWLADWHSGGSHMWMTTIRWPHVALPHAVIAAIGIALYVLAVCGVVTV